MNRKLWAIIKREYLARVRTKAFVISTILTPLIMAFFAVAPALMFVIRTGGVTRVAVIDETGKLGESVKQAVLREGDEDEQSNANANNNASKQSEKQSYAVEVVSLDGRSVDDVKRELSARILHNQLDAYIVIPPSVLTPGAKDAKAEYYGRNTSDLTTIDRLRNRMNDAVLNQRLADAKIERNQLRALTNRVGFETTKVSERGEEKDSGLGFLLAFVVGFVIYFMVIAYGQMMLSAVIEEKTTRISEVLFSSVPAFPLMLGKLIGVALSGLTQFVIWILTAALFSLYGAGPLAASGVALPHLPISLGVYVILFFLLGFFIYATLYLLIGSMVTSVQEAGQVATPVLMLLVAGFWCSFLVIRSPSSSFAFWISLVPFFSPITMLVRIVTETPPFWQIALSLVVGWTTVVGLVWIAARVYRTGMLMYGKRATLPEVWRWVKEQ